VNPGKIVTDILETLDKEWQKCCEDFQVKEEEWAKLLDDGVRRRNIMKS